MKLTTNTILIIFAVMALCVLALIPIGVFAMPLIVSSQSQPVDAQATVQAMVTQTVVALTYQNAPATSRADNCPADEYACAYLHSCSHSNASHVL